MGKQPVAALRATCSPKHRCDTLAATHDRTRPYLQQRSHAIRGVKGEPGSVRQRRVLHQVAAFFEEIGFECKRTFGFECVGAVEIAHVTEEMAEKAIRDIDGDDIDCIVQCGTNLSFVGCAAALAAPRPLRPQPQPAS